MGFFRKKKRVISTDRHSGRFEFEFRVLPSAATFTPFQFFVQDNEGTELVELLFSVYDEMKDGDWKKEYIANTTMNIYDVDGGEISLLKFPEPEGSPELVYAATVLPSHLAESMKEEADIYYRPFYILAKMVDKWCIGEVKYEVKDGNESFYYTEYYKMVDKADPIQFVEWVMAREGLSKRDIVQNDPIEDFLKADKNYIYE